MVVKHVAPFCSISHSVYSLTEIQNIKSQYSDSLLTFCPHIDNPECIY